MSFSNKVIPTKVPGKPHIVLIEGFWRVSQSPFNVYGFKENTKAWVIANTYAALKNQELIRERFHKGT